MPYFVVGFRANNSTITHGPFNTLEQAINAADLLSISRIIRRYNIIQILPDDTGHIVYQGIMAW